MYFYGLGRVNEVAARQCFDWESDNAGIHYGHNGLTKIMNIVNFWEFALCSQTW